MSNHRPAISVQQAITNSDQRSANNAQRSAATATTQRRLSEQSASELLTAKRRPSNASEELPQEIGDNLIRATLHNSTHPVRHNLISASNASQAAVSNCSPCCARICATHPAVFSHCSNRTLRTRCLVFWPCGHWRMLEPRSPQESLSAHK